MEDEDLIDEIYSRLQNVSKEDFLRKYLEISDHFGDTITKETALLLAAYEFGYLPRTKISDVENSRGEVTIAGVVIHAELRDFKRGKLARLIVADESGEIVAVLWEEAAELVRVGDLFPGCEVELKGFVRKKDGEVELSINEPSNVNVVGKREAVVEGYFIHSTKGDGVSVILVDERNNLKRLHFKSGSEKLKADFGSRVGLKFFSDELLDVKIFGEKLDERKFFKKLSEVADTLEMRGVNVTGRVSGIGMLRKIVREDRTIVYAEIYISDESGRVRVLLWGNNSTLFKHVDVGDKVVILNARIKNGEIHCGARTTVLIV
jgi:replication factor A1